MNIFVLNIDPTIAAKCHCDKHVVKMVLESAQLMCTAHRILDSNVKQFPLDFYKSTHINHPCSKWTRESNHNYLWLYSLFVSLCSEYTYRYNKIHLCEIKLKDILKDPPINIPQREMTPFACCMDDLYKRNAIIDSYRNYYIQGKKHMLQYTKREKPQWVSWAEL